MFFRDLRRVLGFVLVSVTNFVINFVTKLGTRIDGVFEQVEKRRRTFARRPFADRRERRVNEKVENASLVAVVALDQTVVDERFKPSADLRFRQRRAVTSAKRDEL